MIELKNPFNSLLYRANRGPSVIFSAPMYSLLLKAKRGRKMKGKKISPSEKYHFWSKALPKRLRNQQCNTTLKPGIKMSNPHHMGFPTIFDKIIKLYGEMIASQPLRPAFVNIFQSETILTRSSTHRIIFVKSFISKVL